MTKVSWRLRAQPESVRHKPLEEQVVSADLDDEARDLVFALRATVANELLPREERLAAFNTLQTFFEAFVFLDAELVESPKPKQPLPTAPSRPGAACIDCGNSITGTHFQRVTGWERSRSQGGTNAIALREPEQVFMCVGCMELRRRQARSGVSAQQMTLGG